MLQQFCYAYLRQSVLLNKLASSARSPQSDQTALTFFAAKSSQLPNTKAAPAVRKKNGKQSLQVPTAPAFILELTVELDRLERHSTAFIEGLWLRLVGIIEQLQRASQLLRERGSGRGAPEPAHHVEGLRRLCDSLGTTTVV